MKSLIFRITTLMYQSSFDEGMVARLMMENSESVKLIKRVLESNELRCYRRLSRSENISDLPSPNIELLIDELGHDAQFPAENTRIEINKGRIVIRRLHTLDWLCRYPIIILDASANQALYEKVFPGHRPEMYTLDIRRSARVVQITDVKAGRRYLKDKSHLNTCLQYIRERAVGRVGIICQKTFEDRVASEFPDAVVGHYGAIRGSREFENCNTLFLLGGAFVGPDELLQQARAIFWREEKIDDLQVRVSKNYGMTSNNFTVGNMHEFQDTRLQVMAGSAFEEEMRQSAYRIRPLEGKGKVIYILSNVPIPGLPPDELDSIRNLKSNRERQFQRRVKYLRRKRRPCSCRIVSDYLEIPISTGKRYWSRLPAELKSN